MVNGGPTIAAAFPSNARRDENPENVDSQGN
jgi:hypothetical protein